MGGGGGVKQESQPDIYNAKTAACEIFHKGKERRAALSLLFSVFVFSSFRPPAAKTPKKASRIQEEAGEDLVFVGRVTIARRCWGPCCTENGPVSLN